MLSLEITTETLFSDGSKYQTFSVKGGVTFSTDEIIFGKGVCEIEKTVYKKINKH